MSSQSATKQIIPCLKTVALSDLIEEKLQEYFRNLDGQLPACSFYAEIMAQVEKPLLKVVLQKVNDNKVQASDVLGISRNTLSKKIKSYNL
tara:strand:- start:70 stop:342 length:273 start_codon:yes stop_codon:yes gene_type:complete